MNHKIIIYSLFVFFISCKNKDSDLQENILLGDKVEVYYTVDLLSNTNPSEWLYGMEREKLCKAINEEVLKNHNPVYSPNQNYFIGKKFTIDEVLEQYSNIDPEIAFKDFKEMLFIEDWFVPADLKTFNKTIKYYSPVRIWHPEEKSDKLYKKLMFFVQPKSNIKGELMATGIFTELTVVNTSFPTGWSGFDPKKFINHVFNEVHLNKIKAYDPIYLVDKTEKVLKPKELEAFLGQELDSDDLRKSTQSIIFEENWYFDRASMNLIKEVLSIGFCREYYADNEHKKKVLFFIKF